MLPSMALSLMPSWTAFQFFAAVLADSTWRSSSVDNPRMAAIFGGGCAIPSPPKGTRRTKPTFHTLKKVQKKKRRKAKGRQSHNVRGVQVACQPTNTGNQGRAKTTNKNTCRQNTNFSPTREYSEYFNELGRSQPSAPTTKDSSALNRPRFDFTCQHNHQLMTCTIGLALEY